MYRIILLYFMINITSCAFFPYRSFEKSLQIVDNIIPYMDTLLLSDIIICKNHREGWKYTNKKQEINHDSVLTIFKRSLNKLPVYINYSDSVRFHCDKDFHHNYELKVSKIENEKIIELMRNKNDQYVFIPYIYLDDWDATAFLFNRRGMINGEKYRAHFLSLIVIIGYRDEIIYLKHYFYDGKNADIDEIFPNPPNPIAQKHWDKLVAKTMKDYIKRMR